MNSASDKPAIREVDQTSFERLVLQSKGPVLVAFWAPWSRPCQVMEAALSEVASAGVGQFEVVKANADDNPDLSLWYEVQLIPTFLCFLDGSPRARLVGTASARAILAKLQPLLRESGALPSASAENGGRQPPDG